MKKILFIRHNILEKPFENYSNLTYDNIIGLSNQSINPKISNDIFDGKTTQKIKEFNPEITYVSNQSRTLQTAHLLGLHKNIIVNENVNEILFDVNTLVSEEEYLKYGLPIIREKLWGKLFQEKEGVENINEIFKRIDNFIEILLEQKKEKICVITHGFLLSIIKKLYSGGKKCNMEKIDRKNMPLINYLECFEIEI